MAVGDACMTRLLLHREIGGLQRRHRARPDAPAIDSPCSRTALGLESVTSSIVAPDGLLSLPYSLGYAKRMDHGRQLLAVTCEEGYITILNASLPFPYLITGDDAAPCLGNWKAHKSGIHDILWNKEDTRFVTAGADRLVGLWDAEQGGLISTCEGHIGGVKTLSVMPGNEDVFASGARDGNVLLWDARVPGVWSTRLQKTVLQPVWDLQEAHSVVDINWRGRGVARCRRSVTAVVFVPNTQTLITSGSGDTCVKFWDVRNSRNPLQTVTLAHGDGLLSPGSQGAGSSHQQQHQQGQAGPALTPLTQIGGGAAGASASQALMPARPTPKTGTGRSSKGKAADVLGPKPAVGPDAYPNNVKSLVTSSMCRPGGPFGVTCMAASDDGASLLVNCTDSRMYLINTFNPGAGPIATFTGHHSPPGNNSYYIRCAFSADGKHALCGSLDKKALIWKVAEPQRPPLVLEGHEGEVCSVSWSRGDTMQVASCADDCTVKVWHLEQTMQEGGAWVPPPVADECIVILDDDDVKVQAGEAAQATEQEPVGAAVAAAEEEEEEEGNEEWEEWPSNEWDRDSDEEMAGTPAARARRAPEPEPSDRTLVVSGRPLTALEVAESTAPREAESGRPATRAATAAAAAAQRQQRPRLGAASATADTDGGGGPGAAAAAAPGPATAQPALQPASAARASTPEPVPPPPSMPHVPFGRVTRPQPAPERVQGASSPFGRQGPAIPALTGLTTAAAAHGSPRFGAPHAAAAWPAAGPLSAPAPGMLNPLSRLLRGGSATPPHAQARRSPSPGPPRMQQSRPGPGPSNLQSRGSGGIGGSGQLQAGGPCSAAAEQQAQEQGRGLRRAGSVQPRDAADPDGGDPDGDEEGQQGDDDYDSNKENIAPLGVREREGAEAGGRRQQQTNGSAGPSRSASPEPEPEPSPDAGGASPPGSMGAGEGMAGDGEPGSGGLQELGRRGGSQAGVQATNSQLLGADEGPPAAGDRQQPQRGQPAVGAGGTGTDGRAAEAAPGQPGPTPQRLAPHGAVPSMQTPLTTGLHVHPHAPPATPATEATAAEAGAAGRTVQGQLLALASARLQQQLGEGCVEVEGATDADVGGQQAEAGPPSASLASGLPPDAGAGLRSRTRLASGSIHSVVPCTYPEPSGAPSAGPSAQPASGSMLAASAGAPGASQCASSPYLQGGLKVGGNEAGARGGQGPGVRLGLSFPGPAAAGAQGVAQQQDEGTGVHTQSGGDGRRLKRLRRSSGGDPAAGLGARDAGVDPELEDREEGEAQDAEADADPEVKHEGEEGEDAVAGGQQGDKEGDGEGEGAEEEEDGGEAAGLEKEDDDEEAGGQEEEDTGVNEAGAPASRDSERPVRVQAALPDAASRSAWEPKAVVGHVNSVLLGRGPGTLFGAGRQQGSKARGSGEGAEGEGAEAEEEGEELAPGIRIMHGAQRAQATKRRAEPEAEQQRVQRPRQQARQQQQQRAEGAGKQTTMKQFFAPRGV